MWGLKPTIMFEFPFVHNSNILYYLNVGENNDYASKKIDALI
jgi:hypothetical protein